MDDAILDACDRAATAAPTSAARTSLGAWYAAACAASVAAGARVRARPVSSLAALAQSSASAFSGLPWVGVALQALRQDLGEEHLQALFAMPVPAGTLFAGEPYGLSWRAWSQDAQGLAYLSIEPVIALLAPIGCGHPSRKRADLPLWALVRGRAARLRLPDARWSLAAPTLPLAAFRLTLAAPDLSADFSDSLAAATDAIEQAAALLLTEHRQAIASLPGFIGERFEADPLVGSIGPPPCQRDDARWQAQLERWITWESNHGDKRPPHGSALANWVDDQRRRARLGRLADSRLAALRAAGFAFHGPGRDRAASSDADVSACEPAARPASDQTQPSTEALAS